jgi:hypothetical protein
MSQATSYQVPAHPSGLDMRTQLNIIVAAILGDNCGPTAPTETYPGMMWGDTTANRLRRRTNANDAWIDIGPLDNFLGDIQGQINTATASKVSKTGDTMTGMLNINLGSAHIRMNAANGTAGPVIQSTGVAGLTGITNAANTAWNISFSDVGNTTIRGGLTVAGIANNGQQTQSGLMQLQNGAGTHGGGEAMWVSSDNYHLWVRGRAGGGLEFVNNAYNTVIALLTDGGGFVAATFQGTSAIYAGNARFQTDGNVIGPSMPNGDLFTALSVKAGNGALCQWQANPQQFSGGNAYTLPAPYVQCGLTGPGNATLNAIGVMGVPLKNS